jgi:hypothetical protein
MYLVSEEYPNSISHFSGSAIYLGGGVCVFMTPILESPVNFITCDLTYHAVWVELLFVFRGEIARMHCVCCDRPFGEAFRCSSSYATAVPGCRTVYVEVSMAAILDFLHNESHSFVMPRDVHFPYFAVCATAENMFHGVSADRPA